MGGPPHHAGRQIRQASTAPCSGRAADLSTLGASIAPCSGRAADPPGGSTAPCSSPCKAAGTPRGPEQHAAVHHTMRDGRPAEGSTSPCSDKVAGQRAVRCTMRGGRPNGLSMDNACSHGHGHKHFALHGQRLKLKCQQFHHHGAEWRLWRLSASRSSSCAALDPSAYVALLSPRVTRAEDRDVASSRLIVRIVRCVAHRSPT